MQQRIEELEAELDTNIRLQEKANHTVYMRQRQALCELMRRAGEAYDVDPRFLRVGSSLRFVEISEVARELGYVSVSKRRPSFPSLERRLARAGCPVISFPRGRFVSLWHLECAFWQTLAVLSSIPYDEETVLVVGHHYAHIADVSIRHHLKFVIDKANTPLAQLYTPRASDDPKSCSVNNATILRAAQRTSNRRSTAMRNVWRRRKDAAAASSSCHSQNPDVHLEHESAPPRSADTLWPGLADPAANPTGSSGGGEDVRV